MFSKEPHIKTQRVAALVFLIFLLLSLLAACAPKDSPLTTSGETKSGTPIVDKAQTSFSVSDVSMTSTPDSSCFSEIGYSKEYSILVVTFRDSGETYLYLDVPQSVWQKFKNADSLGTYYNQNIKNKYDCNKY